MSMYAAPAGGYELKARRKGTRTPDGKWVGSMQAVVLQRPGGTARRDLPGPGTGDAGDAIARADAVTPLGTGPHNPGPPVVA